MNRVLNRVPEMVATIERRILVNFRVDPDVARAVIPEPFEPNLTLGPAIAGICLIRLGDLRPRGLPARVGLTTENAAHRFAIEFDSAAGHGHGVYIPRRDTASRVTGLVGGRLFPGEHHHARFDVRERAVAYEVALESDDRSTRVAVEAAETDHLPGGSAFANLEAASEFFRRDSIGYSVTRRPGRYDAMELEVDRWELVPLAVAHVESSWFGDEHTFPLGSVEFDSAFLMRPTAARWKSHPRLEGRYGPSRTATSGPAMAGSANAISSRPVHTAT